MKGSETRWLLLLTVVALSYFASSIPQGSPISSICIDNDTCCSCQPSNNVVFNTTRSDCSHNRNEGAGSNCNGGTIHGTRSLRNCTFCDETSCQVRFHLPNCCTIEMRRFKITSDSISCEFKNSCAILLGNRTKFGLCADGQYNVSRYRSSRIYRILCSADDLKVSNPCLKNACKNYLNAETSLETEEDEELHAASLYNYGKALHIGTIAISARKLIKKSPLSFTTLKYLLMIWDDSLNRNFSSNWDGREFNDTLNAVEAIEDTLELLTESVRKNECSNSTYTFNGNDMELAIFKFQPTSEESRFQFPSDGDNLESNILSQVSVTIPFFSAFNETTNIEGFNVTIGIEVINNFAEYIQETINERKSNKEEDRTEEEPGTVLLSIVVQSSDNRYFDFQDEPIQITFKPKIETDNSEAKYEGFFLNSQSLMWNNSGLSTRFLDGVIVVNTTHLTSFVVLVSPTGASPSNKVERISLDVVSYIGCTVSIISLLLTIACLLAFRKKLNKGVLLYVHLNLSVSLLLALVVFVAGVDLASRNSVLCTVVAAVIQYFFLCTFCWMLGEGVILYMLVVRVFGNLARRWYLLIPLCWGLPFPLVSISAGILHEDYRGRNKSFCWIDADPRKPAIWTFLGPVIIVSTINTVILVLTMSSILRTRLLVGMSSKKDTHTQLAIVTLKGSVILLPLLGMTWVFGMFAVNSNTSVFAWFFTIINSLQGFFIFIIHIVRNDYILNWLKKTTCRNLRSQKVIPSDMQLATRNGISDSPKLNDGEKVEIFKKASLSINSESTTDTGDIN